MNDELILQINLKGDKLFIQGGAVEFQEFYLPDCTEQQLKDFFTRATNKLAKDLATHRPWRPPNA